MTKAIDTSGYVVLNQHDMDGLVDITKYGLKTVIEQPEKQALLQKLVDYVAKQTFGEAVEPYISGARLDINDEDESAVLLGQAIMTIVPLQVLA